MTMLERKHQLIRELESFTFLSSTDEELQVGSLNHIIDFYLSLLNISL